MLLLEKDREISDLHQANKDVHDDLAQHKTRLRKAETEKQFLLQDITHLNDEINAKNSALKKLNEDLVKAQKTIKVQSDQISGVKDGPKPQSTPQRFGPANAFGQVYSQPPPAYNASGIRITHSQPQPAAPTPHPTPGLRRQSSTHRTFHHQPAFGASSNLNLNQSRPAITPTPNPSFNPFQSQQGTLVRQNTDQASGVNHIAEFNPFPTRQGVLVRQPTDQASAANHITEFNPFQSQPGVLVRQTTDQASGVNLVAEFTPFFHSTETWATNYVRLPDQQKDQFISDPLRNCLALATDPRTAMKLMSTTKTRHLLVARVINQVIADFAFRPMLLRGFTPFYDNRISSFRSQLMGAIPSHVRRGLLLACAETVTDMTQADGFTSWMDHTNIAPRVHDMWHLLSPLFAHGTPRDPAWNDLNRIWREATRIGILMLSKPCIYTLDFPPMGPNSYFNPSNMCSRDEGFTRDAQALSAMAVSVRLAITPIVTETDFMKDAIEAKCLHQAMVLLSF